MNRARTRLLPLLAATLAAGLTGVALAPALAAHVADEPAPPTWSVEPSNAEGSDERESLAYAIDPGTQIRDYVAISNFGATSQTFVLYATDATNDFETGAFGLLPAIDQPTGLGSWITLDIAEVELAPGERAVVPFTALVPSDATPGDHTAGVIASVRTESTDQEGEAIILDQRVAARVYLRVSGDEVAAVEVTGLRSGFSPSWNPLGGGVADVEYAVSNTGNVRMDVGQQIIIRGPFGIELARLEGEDVVNLLPGQAQHVVVESDAIPPLLLLWSSVTLTPSAPTDRVAQSAEQNANGQPVEPRPELKYEEFSAETLTAAISWTLLGVVVVAMLLIWLAVRYVSVTRQRMFDAIDGAAAEAREAALREGESPVTDGGAARERTREPVS